MGEISEKGDRNQVKQDPPDIYIPNYKGSGGIFGDFLHCVRSRELPFRDIEVAHRTAHGVPPCQYRPIGSVGRSSGDPEKEEIIGDVEANRWLDRPKRAPWSMA